MHYSYRNFPTKTVIKILHWPQGRNQEFLPGGPPILLKIALYKIYRNFFTRGPGSPGSTLVTALIGPDFPLDLTSMTMILKHEARTA